MNRLLIVLAIASLGTEVTQASALGSKPFRFKVTLQNVTAANLFSPPLVVALSSSRTLFHLGQPASAGIAQVAETGSTQILQNELMATPGLIAAAQAMGGPILAGDSRSIEIAIPQSTMTTGSSLNFIAMIGKSNDSFIASSGISLTDLSKLKVNGPAYRFAATNYDAGSEENTGNLEDFGPAGHPVDAAEGRISIDRGLNPQGNAPHLIGWGSVSAIVTIERLQ